MHSDKNQLCRKIGILDGESLLAHRASCLDGRYARSGAPYREAKSTDNSWELV